MRIVHLVWSFTTGGIETMLVDIVNEQVKYCDVNLYVINDHYNKALLQTINPKVKVILFNRKPGSKNVIPLVRLNFSLLKYRPDVIHCHQANLVNALWFSWRKVLTIHNTHCSSKYFCRYQRLYCISKSVKDYAASQGFPNGEVIYNGIHINNIDVKDTSGNTKKDKIKILCVGRLHPDKGQRFLIEALDNLVNIRHQINISCDFIGDGMDKNDLENLSAQYQLEDYIKFVGLKSRQWIYSHLKDYDIFVMPSVSEGFGLTLAEACAAKLPVITSDLEGPLEVIAGGKLGVVFRHKDSIDLANKLYHLIVNPCDKSMIEEAYQFTINHFDVANTAHQYIEEYKRSINE